jgi:hypothetical protein
VERCIKGDLNGDTLDSIEAELLKIRPDLRPLSQRFDLPPPRIAVAALIEVQRNPDFVRATAKTFADIDDSLEKNYGINPCIEAKKKKIAALEAAGVLAYLKETYNVRDKEELDISKVDDLLIRGLTDPDISRRDDFMRVCREAALEITKRNYTELQESSDQYNGLPVLARQVVVVGAGPMGTAIAGALSGYIEGGVALIDERNNPGEGWQNSPFNINSQVVVKDPNGPNLPLLSGSSTPVRLGNGVGAGLDASVLLGRRGGSLVVGCDNPLTPARYINGEDLGNLTCVNGLSATQDFWMHTRVDSEKIIYNLDNSGKSLLPLIDVRDGMLIGYIRAETVLFATGPGKEAPQQSQRRSGLREDTAYTNAERDFIERLEGVRNTAIQMRKDDQSADLSSLKVTFPRVLTLTMIQEAYGLYRECIAEGKDGRARSIEHPLAQFVANDHKSRLQIALAGGGDGAAVVAELLCGRAVGPIFEGPVGKSLRRKLNKRGPICSVFGKQINNPAILRSRYFKTFSDISPRIYQEQVEGLLYDAYNSKVKVTTSDTPYNFQTIDFDYCVVATGLSPNPDIPNVAADVDINGGSGISVRRVMGAQVYYAGAVNASGRSYRYPNDISAIISRLRIGENTISLWASIAVVSRLIATLLKNGLDLNQGSTRDCIRISIVPESETPRTPGNRTVQQSNSTKSSRRN